MKKILISILLTFFTFGTCFTEGWVDIKKEWGITISYCEDYKNGYYSKGKIYETYKGVSNDFDVDTLFKTTEYELTSEYVNAEIMLSEMGVFGEDLLEVTKEAFDYAKDYAVCYVCIEEEPYLTVIRSYQDGYNVFYWWSYR